MATDYVPVNVPFPLLKEVDKVVSNQSNGFRSRNEFCVHAIREILKEYRNNYQSKECEKDETRNNLDKERGEVSEK